MRSVTNTLVTNRDSRAAIAMALPVDCGDGLDLHHQVRMRQTRHLDRGAGRQRLAEYLVTDLGMLEELVDVGDVGRGLHQVRQAGARGLERDAQILPDLTDLRAHVAGADDAPVVVTRKL